MTEHQGGGINHADLAAVELRWDGSALPAGAQAARGRRWGWWLFAEHQLRTMRSFAWSLLGYAIGQPVLYLVAMGVGLGALITQSVDGVPYKTFVAPAILVSTVMMSAAGEMTYPVMDGFKWRRMYYGAQATPLAPGQIAVGHFLAVMIRFVVQALVFWLIMLAFGVSPGHWSVLAVLIAVLATGAFAAPLQAYAASLDNEGYQFAAVQRFVVMPMFLFAGTFFPLATMPVYLRWIGWISPVWHGTQLARAVSYGARIPGWLLAIHLLYLSVLVAIGLLAARHVYARRLGS